MPIQKNSVVELAYELYDENGQQIAHDGAPLIYLHGGYHGTFPKVEAALEGKNIGDEIDLTLAPADRSWKIKGKYPHPKADEPPPPAVIHLANP